MKINRAAVKTTSGEPTLPPQYDFLSGRMTSLPPTEVFDQDDEPTGVVGTLREMPVAEIVQTLSQGMKDAVVEVKPKGEPLGVLGLEKGRLVYARHDGVTGEAAFFRLFVAVRGAFRIRYGRKPPERNIDRDVTWLVLEGARILDEERVAVVSPVMFPAVMTTQPSAPSSQTGPFARFFDEAGVKTPPPIPLPEEAQRFHSLRVVELNEIDDTEVMDSDRTTRERRSMPDMAS